MNPCVRGGVATLASCKAKLREGCRVGDAVLVFSKITGGKPVFCMRVDRKVPYADYCDSGRPDALYTHERGEYTRRRGGEFAEYHRDPNDWRKDVGGGFALWGSFSECRGVPADSPLLRLGRKEGMPLALPGSGLLPAFRRQHGTGGRRGLIRCGLNLGEHKSLFLIHESGDKDVILVHLLFR